MTDKSGIEVEIGVTLGKLFKHLAAAEARTAKSAKRMEASLDKGTKQSAKHFKRIDAAVAKSSVSVRRFGGILAGALSVRQLQNYADAWTVAENKIAAAGEVAGRTGRDLSEINDIADRTRSGITETADLYAKLLRATAGVAKSEKEVAKATELVNKAFKAGGAAASEQAAGILQLGQGLSSGVLQGDELRSIRENAPLVAQAIADEFGVTIGMLKELGSQGELTSDRVFQAILSGEAKIEAAFARTNGTIGEGFTRLRNAITEYIGAADKSLGATKKIGVALEFLATNLDSVAKAGKLVVAGIGGAALSKLFATMATKATLASVALVGLSGGARISASSMIALNGTLALLGGPVGAVLVAVSALSWALSEMPTSQSKLELSIDNVTLAMGDEIAQLNQLLALQPGANTLTLSAAQAKLQEAEAIYTKLQAQREELEMTIRTSDAYHAVLQSIAGYREALNSIAVPGADLEDIPAHLRDSYAETEAALAAALVHQQELLNAAGATTAELDAASKNIAKLRDGIENSKNGMVSLNGEIIGGVALTERLASLSGSVSFDGAAVSAQRLAVALGVSLETAKRLAAMGPQGVGQVNGAGAGRGSDPGGSSFDRRFFEGERFLENYKENKPKRGGSRGGSGGGVKEAPLFENAEKQILQLERQIEMIGKTTREIATMTAKYKLLDEAKKRGLDLDVRQTASGKTLREEIDAQAQSIGKLTEASERQGDKARAMDNFNKSLKNSFIDAAFEGENLSDVLRSLAKDLAKAALGADNMFSGLFSGGGGSGGGLLGTIFSGLFPSANGNVFSGGSHVQAYANGGVVNGPAIFPMNGGKTGLMGESGPEAIMPLTRIGGKLGVLSTGGGGGGAQVISVSVNVEGASGDQHIVDLVQQGVSQGMSQVRKEVPGLMVQHQKRNG